MYERQIVSIVDMTSTKQLVEIRDAYEVRTDRPHVWLQKICCNILEKLGAKSWRHDIACNYVAVDVASLYDSFKHQYRQVCRVSGQAPKEVLMGGEDFAELVGAPNMQRVVEFEIYLRSDPYAYGRIHGINIRVLPWMQGILIVTGDE